MLGTFALVSLSVVAPIASGAGGVERHQASGVPTNCPWTQPGAAESATPDQLASEVMSRMDLADKIRLVDLSPSHGYENRLPAMPQFCLPALTLQDGPNGIAFGDTGVTALPSSLALAASFNPQLAFGYGRVEGSEAHGQAIDVVQGPNLGVDRVPEAGRAFEGYGEDPLLISEMGDGDIEGIQSEGVMADAKHFTAYNQETDRVTLNELVSQRALEEIYLPPFKSAVTDAHVASIMCSYGLLNGINDCSNPTLFKELYNSWGFQGFVRSDLHAVPNAILAFIAGLDVIKPAQGRELNDAVQKHILAMHRLNDAVHRLLTAEFAYQLIEQPLNGHVGGRVATPAHARFALTAAEQSMVLLKNSGVLPLRRGTSLALIGAAAAGLPNTAGGGSSYVVPPFDSSPVRAIAAANGRGAPVTYTPGGTLVEPYPVLAEPIANPLGPVGRLAKKVIATEAGTGTFPPRLAGLLSNWSTELYPPASGTYEISVTGAGDTWLSLNHHLIYASTGTHSASTWTVAVNLDAYKPQVLSMRWYQGPKMMTPQIGWRYVSPAIAAAVHAARHAKVAVVFADDASAEGTDRPSLSLPGDENALISAVAAVNRHTVVVLNTGGPVLMPWLSKVSAVVEAWYPGEQDGAATAAVLYGKADPGGHLPVTFPASGSQTPAHTQQTWPGSGGTVLYSEGLDVGYRYQDAHHLTPLFPFGYGLSYTRFSESGLQVVPDGQGGVDALVTVSNLGNRAGTDVVQAYLGFPAAAGEPPRQLKSFLAVPLAAHSQKTVTLSLPASAFTCYLNGAWRSVPGDYTLWVGESSRRLPLSTELQAPAPVSPTTGASGAPGPSGASGTSGQGGQIGVSGQSGGSGPSGTGATGQTAAP